MGSFGSVIRDVTIAILRLILLQTILFVNGLHHIFFNRMEVSNLSLVVIPQRRDREKLAFVDDLQANNLDLMSDATLPPADGITFHGDDEDDLSDYDYGDDEDDEDDDGEEE